MRFTDLPSSPSKAAPWKVASGRRSGAGRLWMPSRRPFGQQERQRHRKHSLIVSPGGGRDRWSRAAGSDPRGGRNRDGCRRDDHDSCRPVTGSQVLTLTAWQVANLDAEAAGHGGITGADLDTMLPMPANAPTLADILGGWVIANRDPTAAAAGALLGNPDWTHPEQVVFPTAVLTLFEADLLQHVSAASSAASQPASPAASPAASGAALAREHPPHRGRLARHRSMFNGKQLRRFRAGQGFWPAQAERD